MDPDREEPLKTFKTLKNIYETFMCKKTEKMKTSDNNSQTGLQKQTFNTCSIYSRSKIPTGQDF